MSKENDGQVTLISPHPTVSVTKENTPGQDLIAFRSEADKDDQNRIREVRYLPYDPTTKGRSNDLIIEDYCTGKGTEKVTETYEVNSIHFLVKNGRMQRYVGCCEGEDYDLSPEKKEKRLIKKLMKKNWVCRACSRRAYKFFNVVGPNRPAFLENITHPNDGCPNGSLFHLREELWIYHSVIKNPEIFIVVKDTFPVVEEGIDKKTGESFPHVTIKPDRYTHPRKAKTFKRFLEIEVPVCQTRLSKLRETFP